VSQMARLHPFDIDPKRAAALTHDHGEPNLAIPSARQVGDKGFECFAIRKLPGPRQSKHRPVAQLLDQRHVSPRGEGRIGHQYDLLTPSRRPAITEHLAKRGILGLIARIILAPEHGEIHRDAIDAPEGREERGPKAEGVRMMPAGDVYRATGGYWPRLPSRVLSPTRYSVPLSWFGRVSASQAGAHSCGGLTASQALC
jgi:hypothetical protein